MELDKFDRQLRLMLLLVQNRRLSVDEISERLGLNRRSIYRYLESFRKLGFIVRKEGSRYSIDHESPFFQSISDRIHFSTDEAITINQVLNSVLDNSPQVRHLRQNFPRSMMSVCSPLMASTTTWPTTLPPSIRPSRPSVWWC